MSSTKREFKGFEWLLIDAANQFGLDRELFETRIEWANEHLDTLELMVGEADEPELFMSAVIAIRKAQHGKATGHLVGLDAICSGLQIMGACLNDYNPCWFTGLLDSGTRPDAYMATAGHMQAQVDRSEVKYPVMTHFYGSSGKPKETFQGDMLQKFYAAVDFVAPLPNQFRNATIALGELDKPVYEWMLPDGSWAVVPVFHDVQRTVEIPELGGMKVTHYIQTEGQDPEQRYVACAANIIHSLDAFVVDEMAMACNWDRNNIQRTQLSIMCCDEFAYEPEHDIEKQWKATGYLAFRAMEYIGKYGASEFTLEFCEAVLNMIEDVTSYRSFPIISNHDEFKCHPNHCNRMTHWYREILARFSEARILENIYEQITDGKPLLIQRGNVTGDQIRQSVYTLS